MRHIPDYSEFVSEKASYATKRNLVKAKGSIGTILEILALFGYDQEWLKQQFNALAKDKIETTIQKQDLDAETKKKIESIVMRPLESGAFDKGFDAIMKGVQKDKQVRQSGFYESYDARMQESWEMIEEGINWGSIKKQALSAGKAGWDRLVMPAIKKLFNHLASILVEVTYSIISAYKGEEVIPPSVDLFNSREGQKFLKTEPKE